MASQQFSGYADFLRMLVFQEYWEWLHGNLEMVFSIRYGISLEHFIGLDSSSLDWMVLIGLDDSSLDGLGLLQDRACFFIGFKTGF